MDQLSQKKPRRPFLSAWRRVARKWRTIFGFLALTAFSQVFAGGPDEADLDRIRAECMKQVKAENPQYDREQRGWLVHDCVVSKRQTSWTPPRTFPLHEFQPWLVKNKGPAQAKGVIYFVPGFGGYSPLDAFRLAPYYLLSLNKAGWDVLAGKFPENFSFYPNPMLYQLADLASDYVGNRLRQLRKEGYRKVVYAGHSWGATVGLLSQQSASSLDGMILTAPNRYGAQTLPSGKFNINYEKNYPEVRSLLASVKTPTFVAFFQGDDHLTDDYGPAAKQALQEARVAHVIINRPPGFSGHYAGWLPFLDFAFGQCLHSFLEDSAHGTCRMPQRDYTDFRSAENLAAAKPAKGQPITSPEALVGNKYVSYVLKGVDNRYLDYASAQTRKVTQSKKQFDQDFQFKGGKHCAAGACTTLVRWSESEIAEYSEDGALKAWWIREN